MEGHELVCGFGEFIVFVFVFEWRVRLQDWKKILGLGKIAIGLHRFTSLLYSLIVSYQNNPPSLERGEK